MLRWPFDLLNPMKFSRSASHDRTCASMVWTRSWIANETLIELKIDRSRVELLRKRGGA